MWYIKMWKMAELLKEEKCQVAAEELKKREKNEGMCSIVKRTCMTKKAHAWPPRGH